MNTIVRFLRANSVVIDSYAISLRSTIVLCTTLIVIIIIIATTPSTTIATLIAVAEITGAFAMYQSLW